MTIETKLNIGQRIIVEIDGGFCKGTITDIHVHASNDGKDPIISYLARINEKTRVPTKDGTGTVLDNRKIFIVEPWAMTLLKAYKKLMHGETRIDEELALARLRGVVGTYKPKELL